MVLTGVIDEMERKGTAIWRCLCGCAQSGASSVAVTAEIKEKGYDD